MGGTWIENDNPELFPNLKTTAKNLSRMSVRNMMVIGTKFSINGVFKKESGSNSLDNIHSKHKLKSISYNLQGNKTSIFSKSWKQHLRDANAFQIRTQTWVYCVFYFCCHDEERMSLKITSIWRTYCHNKK